MLENPTPADSRLTAALDVMQRAPQIPGDAIARTAARAVLANAPARRATRWSLRAAALVGIVALGATAVNTSNRFTARPAPQVATTVSAPSAVMPSTITPVMATVARPIVFEFDAPAARSVQVLGDFNDWSRTSGSMQRGADGRWRITALVRPGRYIYAYLVDGERFLQDPVRDAVEDRDFGVTGSELVVGEAP